MLPMPFLKKLDAAVYRVERATCIALIAAMVVAVFLDVAQRTASTKGPLDRLFARFLPEGAAAVAATIVAAALALIFAYGALRGAKFATPLPAKRAAILAVAGVAGAWLAIRLLLFLAPNGLIWSQTFALSAMLWVGFLGASMCTKEGSHLTLEIVEFVWKGKAKAQVARVGALFAALFIGFLGWLCFRLVVYHHRNWADSGGEVGVFEGFPAPQFVVYAILPITMTVMALRFLGRALGPLEEEKPPQITPIVVNEGEPS